MSEEERIEKGIQLNNSAIYDVHKWSEYSEVKNAVDFIYKELGELGYAAPKKKHIKPLIIDLYAKWLEDETKYVAIGLGRNFYSCIDSRYNKLHITHTTAAVVHELKDAGYIDLHLGNEAMGRLTRIRATSKLLDLIVDDYKFTPEMIERAPETECIVLRDYDTKKKKQKDVSYDDTPFTESMRKEVTKYNNLLYCSFIDIPTAPSEGIPTKSKDNKVIKVSQYEKFTRRIFSNDTFEEGGRYYGGWWQRIPKEWRERIFIGNIPVTEIDYSGLHIILLYASVGVDYWNEVKTDPYKVKGLESSDRMRSLLKQVLLTAINAKNPKSALKGVRKKINFNKDEYGWVYDESIDLEGIITQFAEEHKPISSYFFSGYGVNLQNLDSDIATLVINHFTDQDIPVLCVHDSFIVATAHSEELKKVMESSINSVINKIGLDDSLSKIKSTGIEIGRWGALTGDPDYHDQAVDILIKMPYEYPEWKERLDHFKRLKLSKEYYIAR